jgi:hypothetical protein
MKPLLTLAGLILALFSLATCAKAQTHHHPTGPVTGATAKFYETWKRPDQPEISCCDHKDCYATPARVTGGTVMALHRESGDWIVVPDTKVERDRETPDGLNHLCANPQKLVFCFVWGGGG